MFNTYVIPTQEGICKNGLGATSLNLHGLTRWLVCVFLFCCFVLLNGCSTTTKVSQKDGPPPFDVDVSKIPDAKPRCEPLAKYGNMPVYRVFGKPYKVMKSARHYKERGVASWYGMKFHSRNTSSGEPYNLLAMTAAHKSLPLPTYVKVTNVKNGRKVIVKVNDRGPFASNRIIDLSYVAAKKLGMLGHGTAFVEVEAIDPRERYSQPNMFAQNTIKSKIYGARSARPGVYLQVGAFKNRKLAENLRRRITPLTKASVKITSNGIYRVQIGPIKDIITADYISKKLRQIGLRAEHKVV